MKRVLLLLAFVSLPTLAAEPAKPAGTLIDFRVEVQRPVANDLGRASAYIEQTGSDPAEVARKVKSALAEGLATAKAQPAIIVKSGGTHTTPIYGKTGRVIDAWRMRAELLIESRDAEALSSVLGQLQAKGFAIGQLQFMPAPETRRQAEDDATLAALEAFNVKAARIAASLKKPYKIRTLSVNTGGHFPPPYPLARGVAMMAAEAAPMPVEAGESNLTVNVSGQIELLD